MKKKLLITLVIVLVLGFVALFYATSSSGDIKKYESFYANDTASPSNGKVKVTFFGVSTLLFDDDETQILIDGFFSRPSTWQLLTSNIASDTATIDRLVSQYKMDRVKGIFTTHSHYDHAFDVAYTAKKTKATLFGSVSTINIGKGSGLKEEQLHLFKAFDEFHIGQFTVQIIPSKHSQPNSLGDDGVIISQPLSQPANMKAYSEGGSFDFLLKHNGHQIFIKPSPNFVAGVLDSLKADVIFVGIGTVGKKDLAWQNTFYEQTIGKLKPKLVVPLHWDDFTKPLSNNLEMLPHFADDTPKAFDFMIQKTKADSIDFKILQGGKSILLL